MTRSIQYYLNGEHLDGWDENDFDEIDIAAAVSNLTEWGAGDVLRADLLDVDELGRVEVCADGDVPIEALTDNPNWVGVYWVDTPTGTLTEDAAALIAGGWRECRTAVADHGGYDAGDRVVPIWQATGVRCDACMEAAHEGRVTECDLEQA